MGIIDGYLNLDEIKWAEKSAVGVVLASKGYPGKYETGKIIHGLNSVDDQYGLVFHAGTKNDRNKIITSGGRVLTVTSFGESVKEAISNVYRQVDKINFEDMYFRQDIGWRAQSGVELY